MVSAVSPPIMTRNVGLKGFQPLAIDRRMRPMKLNGGPASHGSTQPTRPTSWSSAPRMIRTIIFSARQIIPQSANGGPVNDGVDFVGGSGLFSFSGVILGALTIIQSASPVCLGNPITNYG